MTEIPHPCDKCYTEVRPNNNVLYWAIAYDALRHNRDPTDAIITFHKMPLNMIAYPDRHLNATDTCPGSPSRRTLALEGMISYDQGRTLPREEWKPATHDEAAAALHAFWVMQALTRNPDYSFPLSPNHAVDFK